MSLYLYDFEGNELGYTDKIISSYRNTLWNDIGTAEFHIENNDAFVSIVTKKHYLFLEDENGFQDIVIGYEYGEDFTLYCRSLSWLLSKMIIPPTDFSGTIAQCAEELLEVSYGCEVFLGEMPEIKDNFEIKTDDISLFSDTLKSCLNSAHLGHKLRFSHSDNKFYLDILAGRELDFYVSENDCTLESLTLKSDILDFSNSLSFKKRMAYLGRWNPSSNKPSLYDNDSANYASYYEVQLDSTSHTRFGISWSDGDYIYCNTANGKLKKSTTPPEDFHIYIPDTSVSDKYRWYHISYEDNEDEALKALSEHKLNKNFSSKSRNLVFLKDYRLGDFIKLQYTLNNETITVPCQFSSVTINRDNVDNTENPTLKEVK